MARRRTVFHGTVFFHSYACIPVGPLPPFRNAIFVFNTRVCHHLRPFASAPVFSRYCCGFPKTPSTPSNETRIFLGVGRISPFPSSAPPPTVSPAARRCSARLQAFLGGLDFVPPWTAVDPCPGDYTPTPYHSSQVLTDPRPVTV